MKTVSIGRRSSNEVSIKDPLVSRDQHCLITEENGCYYIFDANSTNGTYVNGSRIPNAEKIRLHHGDVVRIGNTVLPWQSYFGGRSEKNPPVSYPQPTPLPQIGGDTTKESSTTALQAIALLLSLVGLGCIVYTAIKIMQWGIFGLAANEAVGLVGAVASLIAVILAKIADFQEETDNTTMSSIAEWIGSTCLCVIIAFVIIINVNPDLLNPFVNLFK